MFIDMKVCMNVAKNGQTAELKRRRSVCAHEGREKLDGVWVGCDILRTLAMLPCTQALVTNDPLSRQKTKDRNNGLTCSADKARRRRASAG